MTRIALLLTAAICGIHAQNAITLAGGGYRTPHPAQDVAPGQLLVVYLFGVKTTIPNAQLAALTPSGWPDNINGVSVALVQGNPPEVTPVEVRGIQQAQCPQPEACAAITGITIQAPFSIHADYLAKGEPLPQLRIGENGKTVGGIMPAAVSDNVHVIDTCDNTLIFLSAAFDVPQVACSPMVMNGARLASPTNPGHAGSALAMYLYGLGATTPGPGPSIIDRVPSPIHQV